MEVRAGEGGAEGWVLEALAEVDEVGFHGGVEVVFPYPVADAFGEGEVVERVVQMGDGAADLEDLVDGAGVVGAIGADEADVEGGDLGVLKPGAEEEVAAAELKGGGAGWAGEDGALHFGGELGCGALVGVEEEDPGVAEAEVSEGGVAVLGVVVKGALSDGGAGGLGDFDGAVGGVGVEDVDVVAPADGAKAVREVASFVAGEDEGGDQRRCGWMSGCTRERVKRDSPIGKVRRAEVGRIYGVVEFLTGDLEGLPVELESSGMGLTLAGGERWTFERYDRTNEQFRSAVAVFRLCFRRRA